MYELLFQRLNSVPCKTGCRAASGATHEAAEQCGKEQHKENEKENLGDACCRHGDPTKTENRGNDRDNKKSDGPT
jgi:hypothetical protein